MADITQSTSVSLLDRLDEAAIASSAPSQADLMRELRIKPKPGWTSHLPPSLAAFVTNPQGMTGVMILLGLLWVLQEEIADTLIGTRYAFAFGTSSGRATA